MINLLFLNKAKEYEDYYVPKVICFSSLTPYPYELGYLLEKILKHSGFGFDFDSLNKKIDKNENKDIGKKEIITEIAMMKILIVIKL